MCWPGLSEVKKEKKKKEDVAQKKTMEMSTYRIARKYAKYMQAGKPIPQRDFL